MTEPEKTQTEGELGRDDPQVPLMFFEPPWTEADEIWAECLTGEYDRRMEREERERQARAADL